MERAKIDAVFSRRFNGQPNPMTDTVIDRFEAHGLLWEISTGKFMDQWLGGVTVLTFDGEDPPGKLNQCFGNVDRNEAIRLARKYAENGGTL